jgi:hypothetical protein
LGERPISCLRLLPALADGGEPLARRLRGLAVGQLRCRAIAAASGRTLFFAADRFRRFRRLLAARAITVIAATGLNDYSAG